MLSAAHLAATLVLAAQSARETPSAGADVVTLPHCVVSLIDQVSLAAQLPGMLIEVPGFEGKLVREAELLARIDDTEAKVRLKSAQAKLAVATEKASNDSEVRAAKKVAELYQAEYEESVAINKRSPDVVAQTQMRRQRVQWEKGLLDGEVEAMKFQVAKLDQRFAETEVEVVEVELERRVLRSPFDGVIVQLLRHQAEWVQPGDPVLRVIRMDRLRIEGFVQADQIAPEQVAGANVTVKVKLAGGKQEELPGKVDFVNPIIEASGDYRIFADIDNRPGRGGYAWLVRPGADVEMSIHLRKAGVAPPRPLREH
jgi:multidrug resistance efflux pump